MAEFISVEDYLAPPKTDSLWGEIFYSPDETPTKYIPLSIPELEVWDEVLPEVAAWMELEEQF